MPDLGDEWMDAEQPQRQVGNQEPWEVEGWEWSRCYERKRYFTNNTQKDGRRQGVGRSVVGTGQGKYVESNKNDTKEIILKKL